MQLLIKKMIICELLSASDFCFFQFLRNQFYAGMVALTGPLHGSSSPCGITFDRDWGKRTACAVAHICPKQAALDVPFPLISSIAARIKNQTSRIVKKVF
jgi:hypothetical protein